LVSFRFCCVSFRFVWFRFRFILFRFCCVSFRFRFILFRFCWMADWKIFKIYGKIWLWKNKIIRILHQKAHHFPASCVLCKFLRFIEKKKLTVHQYYKWLCKTVHDLCLFLQTGNLPSSSCVSIRIFNLTSQIDIEWSRLCCFVGKKTKQTLTKRLYFTWDNNPQNANGGLKNL
jgi:hypothetical protein